jgi:hypothetical protein
MLLSNNDTMRKTGAKSRRFTRAVPIITQCGAKVNRGRGQIRQLLQKQILYLQKAGRRTPQPNVSQFAVEIYLRLRYNVRRPPGEALGSAQDLYRNRILYLIF